MTDQTPPQVQNQRPSQTQVLHHPPQTFRDAVKNAIVDSEEYRFVIGVLKKVIVFVVVALSAVGIHKIVELTEKANDPAFITYALTFVAYFILVVDILWFIRALSTEVALILSPIFTKIGTTIILIVALIIGIVIAPYVNAKGLELLKFIGSYIPRS
jgi:hypothetical protein